MPTVSVISGIGFDVLADVNVDVMAASITVEIGMSELLEKLMPFCRAIFRWLSMSVLGCTHVLQAWMPSDHV